jgi:hypothetical protein
MEPEMTCDECGTTNTTDHRGWWVDQRTRHILCPRCVNTEDTWHAVVGKNIYTGTPGDSWGDTDA